MALIHWLLVFLTDGDFKREVLNALPLLHAIMMGTLLAHTLWLPASGILTERKIPVIQTDVIDAVLTEIFMGMAHPWHL